MPLIDRVAAALRASDRLSPVSKAAYIVRLGALQRIVGRGLEHVLLDPQETLSVLKRHRCASSMRPMAASTLKAYVATALAALKHCAMLRTKPRYRRARCKWVHAFKQLRSQVDTHYRKCASGEALPNRCNGYVAWSDLCRVRDRLPLGTIERLLLELHTCCLGRSREYAAVRLFTEPPSKELRRQYPNHCVLHPNGPAGSYLRFGDFKTSGHVGAYKVPLTASLHRAIMSSLKQQPRQHLIEPPSRPGHPFTNANSFNKYCCRRFKAVFGRPLTSNTIRHSFVNSLDLTNQSQLEQAARRLAHTNVDTLQRLYLWGAFKR